jgi:hypothetical protein
LIVPANGSDKASLYEEIDAAKDMFTNPEDYSIGCDMAVAFTQMAVWPYWEKTAL